MEFETNFKCKKILSICLCLVLLFSMCNCVYAAAADNNTNGKKITDYSVGDIVEFGWYPQSKVDDTALIAELNALGGDNSTWTSYGYYSGTGSDDGQMTAGDWMRYTDVIYGSNKYRGVIFDSYRPAYTGDTLSSTGEDEYGYSISEQKDNGYNVGTVYWFLYEPIEWRVLDPKTGMVMSETILDSQAYNNYILSSDGYYWGDSSKTYYANNYAESSIRQWLNNDFYNTAFSSAQQDIIEYTPLDNSAYSISYSEYNSNATDDKIYLPAYSDVGNANYGFSTSKSDYDTARRAQGSDYAKSQGLDVSTSSTYGGNSYWRLRSAGSSSYDTCPVDYDGYVYNYYYTVLTNFGVRPALNFNPESDVFQSDVKDTGKSTANGAHVHKGGTATCNTLAVCTSCGLSYGKYDYDNHVNIESREAVEVTCTIKHTAGTYCNDCKKWISGEYTSGQHTDENNDEICDVCSMAIPKLELVIESNEAKLYAKNCQNLQSCNLNFNFDSDVVTKVRCASGYDAKQNNDFSHECNQENVADVKYGFYFKDCLWSSEKFAEEDLSGNTNINGEYFHLATFTLTLADGKTASDIAVSFTGSCGFIYNGDGIKYAIDMVVIGAHVHTGGTATCSTKAVCTACGTSYGELDKSNHENVVTVKAVAATCTKTGLTEGKKCSVCGEVTVKQQTVAALGHDKINHAAKAATCTEKGYEAYVTCSRCDYTTYKELAALGHNYSSEWTIDKAPTSTAAGSKSHHCTYCDSITDVTAIPATTNDTPNSTQNDNKNDKTDNKPNETPSIPNETPNTPSTSDYILGNIDADGEITAADARLALRTSVELEKIEEGTSKFLAADVDNDDAITAADARLILRASVELETL